jgi:hypothetical protein
MKRFDYERYSKKRDFRYAIVDRKIGLHYKVATVYDVAEAELICEALNEQHNNIIQRRSL